MKYSKSERALKTYATKQKHSNIIGGTIYLSELRRNSSQRDLSKHNHHKKKSERFFESFKCSTVRPVEVIRLSEIKKNARSGSSTSLKHLMSDSVKLSNIQGFLNIRKSIYETTPLFSKKSNLMSVKLTEKFIDKTSKPSFVGQTFPTLCFDNIRLRQSKKHGDYGSQIQKIMTRVRISKEVVHEAKYKKTLDECRQISERALKLNEPDTRFIGEIVDSHQVTEKHQGDDILNPNRRFTNGCRLIFHISDLFI